MMSNEKFKLHPVSAIINFAKGLKELVIPFIIIFVSNGFNIFDSGKLNFWKDVFPTLVLLIPMIMYLISGIIKWWTFLYWFEDNELRVKYGLFVKKKRYIPFDRIQSLNYKEGIFHRIFGLVQVIVETAGNTDGKPEVVLTAIRKEAADHIEQETRKGKGELAKQLTIEDPNTVDVDSDIEPSRIIHKMTSKDLVILATTSNSIGVVLAGVAAVLSQFSEFIPYKLIYEEIATFIKYGIVIVSFAVFSAFFLAWLVSIIITFINYYDFTLIEENNRLIITRGLLEKKRITIPLNRIQAIKIVENPFRQMFGLAAVVVESASGGFGEKEKKITLFPLISKKELLSPLQHLFPQMKWEQTFTQPPKKSKPFFYRIDFIWLVPIIGICSYFYFPLGLLSILLILPAILIGLWQYKTTGYALKGNQLTIVYRVISRVTFIVEKKRIQSMESRQSYFQKRKKIASIQATVMSGFAGATAKAAHLDENDVEVIMKWFERSN